MHFRMRLGAKDDSGRLCVMKDKSIYLFSNIINAYSGVIYPGDKKVYSTNGNEVTDFEIVPRDPETYMDWQVGDMVHLENPNCDFYQIIFRNGHLVAVSILNVDDEESLYGMFTCDELYRKGYRLVLTDIERQIIEDQKKYLPKDGDIVYIHNDGLSHVSIFKERKGDDVYIYADYFFFRRSLYLNSISCRYSSIEQIRPATEEEERILFDSLANMGKRWNAEKKCMEDIRTIREFKNGEPVLVRKDNGRRWQVGAFSHIDNSYADRPYVMINGNICGNFKYCIPYNEKTMHLLGTTEDYKEEQ